MTCRHRFVAVGPYVQCDLCKGGRELRGWKAACRRLLGPRPAERTAIIVNDRGEVFVGWRSAVSLSESGYETYYSVPCFARVKRVVVEPGHLRPMGTEVGDVYYLNSPKVYGSVRAAERAARRIGGFPSRLAVVY